MAAISSRTSSSLKLPTLTPGICSAEASKVSVPADSGSGDRPGSVNEVVPSNTLIDHRRLPWLSWISPPCTVAPATAPNEYVPPLTRMLLGGGSHAFSATVDDRSASCTQPSDD